MKHTFSYIQAGIWYRPIIPVSLRLSSIQLKYLALIDSGADFNIFHAEIASILKIDLKKLKTMEFAGVNGGKSTGYFSAIDIGINGKYFNMPVVFSYEISDNGYGILGQQGFFNKYTVTFIYKAKKIEITT